MPELPLSIVDAFTHQGSGGTMRGNPAAVALLTDRENAARDDHWRLTVASEMNLSETAFVVPREDGDFDLRWFTPTVEVDLCGHATLAAAHVLWESNVLPPQTVARFHTRSGLLSATQTGGMIELDFPAQQVTLADPPPGLIQALNLSSAGTPQAVLKAADDWLVHIAPDQVSSAAPNMQVLRHLSLEHNVRGVIITASAANDEFPDFVSRFFAPAVGVDEDPVTGSAHTKLGPYWSKLLGKDEVLGYQASRRGGLVRCRVREDRVLLGGQAETTLRGTLLI